MPIPINKRQALESFIVSPLLAELETRFTRFNVFEALGVQRRELTHSNFLAYLLSPTESHGLRGLFTHRFLQEAVREASNQTLTVMELDAIDFRELEVRREHNNIDILLADTLNKIVIVIENKVESKQHSDQLNRYFQTATSRHPGFRFVGIYLTKDGEKSNNPSYASMSYETVRGLVIDLLSRESVLLPPGFRSVLEQYADLLGRRFMADTELQELCRKIYKKHKQAIDILRDNIPDSYGVAFDTIKSLVEASGLVLLEDSDKSGVRFIPQEFSIPQFKSETARYLKSGQMVYLACIRKDESIYFQAKMDGGSVDERARVYKFAATSPPFKVDRTVYGKYQILYNELVVEDVTAIENDEELVQRLTDKWKTFVANKVAAMSAACQAYSFPEEVTGISS